MKKITILLTKFDNIHIFKSVKYCLLTERITLYFMGFCAFFLEVELDSLQRMETGKLKPAGLKFHFKNLPWKRDVCRPLKN